jgi:Ca2+-binding RTX toxin-like protein
VPSADFASQPPGTYDDEMLDAHFACGDGRCNENIGLSSIHQVFHSEHNRLVADMTATIEGDPALLAAYEAPHPSPLDPTVDISFGYGGRLFQAARFVTEMEYQHLVFEEFARKVQPAINPFEPFAFAQTDLNPAVKAEFAHAVYRFGHSMLTETIDRRNEDLPGPDGVYGTRDDLLGTENDISLLDGFLNPPAYFDGGAAGTLTPQQAAGSIVMGMSDQTGNELDEFVTDTLRNNLLGLPLDLATINMTRARSEGVPPLNVFRRNVFDATNDGQMTPYTNWIDFGEHLKHPESLINFVAAYGRHPSITSQSTAAGRREAARLIVNPDALAGDVSPADAAQFMNSIGPWANNGTSSVTGLDTIDLWVGGLAEVTNLFGGLLGSTFNYVFENQLTELQNGDRLYYLARTPGMNLRLQLEGNSFAEMIMRNTDAHSLKADAFATADCKFELRNLDGTAAGFDQFGNTVADDPQTDCDETALLLRLPDGTIKYRARNTVDPSGINGQSVYNGTAGVDRIHGGNDSDTFWGGLGNDIIEGGDGADVALGGEGDDIITDLNGDDVPKGGPGDDAIDAGPGLDIIMGGEGNDFTNGGANSNETFGGPGDDFMMLGDGLDAGFGDSGDDWEEGGNQPDLMQGDSGNLFFLDDSQLPGSDVLIGQGGDDDYDMEGGDDIGVSGPGVEKVAGASGYDWEIGLGDPQPQDLDLALPIAPLDILTVGVRDKFNEVEALSGAALDDTLRGDDIVPSARGGAGFIGCDVLDQSGVNRISGLDPLLPALSTPLATVVANSASRDCPILSGPVWGDGNILLGGAGNDVIEGRGADDVIDGDRYLNVRLSVRNDAGVEIGSASVDGPGQSAMTSQYLRDASGALTGPTLQQAVFAGTVDPGNIVLVREILSPAAQASVCTGATLVNCDTAVFAGPRSNYTVTQVPATADELAKLVVTQVGANVVGQRVSDGTDSLRNIEQLRFSDQTVTIAPSASAAPTTLAFGNQPVGTSSALRNVTVTNTGLTNLVVSGATVGDPSFQLTNGCTTVASGGTCTIGVLFRPTSSGAKSTTLSVSHNGSGSPSTVTLTGTGIITPAAATVTPTALPFGLQRINTSSAARTVTVTNTGGSPLVVSGVTVTRASFLVSNGCTTVAPGASCSIGVVFRPTTIGGQPATLLITHNAAGSPSLVALGGTGFTVPGAPVIGTAARGAVGNPITAIARWTPPASNGGAAITGYRVFALRMSSAAANATVLQTITSAVQPTNARQLQMTVPAGTYRFQVVAINAAGAGPRSARSNAVVAR